MKNVILRWNHSQTRKESLIFLSNFEITLKWWSSFISASIDVMSWTSLYNPKLTVHPKMWATGYFCSFRATNWFVNWHFKHTHANKPTNTHTHTPTHIGHYSRAILITPIPLLFLAFFLFFSPASPRGGEECGSRQSADLNKCIRTKGKGRAH